MQRKANSTWEKWANASSKDFFTFKWESIIIQSDKRTILLGVVEILLAVCIAAAITIYLDPNVNVVPYPWNVVTFGVLVGVTLLIHRRTRPFRIARRMKREKN